MDVLAVINLVLLVLGMFTTAAGFVIPRFTTFIEIQQEQSVGHRSSYLYVAGFINCLLYVFFPKGSVVLTLLNIFGAFAMACYFWKYMEYCEQDDFLSQLVFPTAGVLGTLGLLALYESNREQYMVFYMCYCAVWRGTLGVLPLIKMPVVYFEQNTRTLPSLLLCFTSLANAMIWCAFACTGTKLDGYIYLLAERCCYCISCYPDHGPCHSEGEERFTRTINVVKQASQAIR